MKLVEDKQKKVKFGELEKSDVLSVEQAPAPSRITAALALHLASGRNQPKKLDIFSQLDETTLSAVTKFDEAHTIDRNGKPFYITNFQTRLLFHLSKYITQQTDIEDVSLAIAAMNMHKRTPNGLSVRRPIKIDDFAKSVYKKKTKTQRLHLLRNLIELASTNQAQSFEWTRDNVLENGEIEKETVKETLFEPVIQIVGGTQIMRDGVMIQYADATDEELKSVKILLLSFGWQFFFGLTNRYALIPDKLLDLWGQKGNGTETELFAVFLTRELSEYWYFWANYQNFKDKARKDAREKGLDKDEKREFMDEETKKTQHRYLEAGTLNDCLRNPYEKSKKSRFRDDLKKALAIFAEINLIEPNYSIDKKSLAMTFDFSLKYGK